MDAKMLWLVAYLLLIMPLRCLSQVYDDFSDGDFTGNPTWSGDVSLFVVNADQQLQLNAEAAGNAELFCDEAVTDFGNMEWHFWLREAFAPSTKNYSDIYLCNNYFIRFGEAGSNDVLELRRVDGDNSVSVCRGTDTFIASAFSAYFKVTRDNQGLWKIFVDKSGNDGYIIETQGVDNTYGATGRFGIKTTFSASNIQKVYLDDVYFGPLIIDTQPPSLVNITVLKNNKLQLDFDEPVDETDALDSHNYSVNNGLGNPMYAEFYGTNHSCVILSYANNIEENIEYTLTINEIRDIEGNVTTNIQFNFVHTTLHENDVVINEIMTDPEPVVGLPPVEYIELFNTTDYPINLKNWTLMLGTSEKQITQDIDIQPLGFVLLCKESSIEQLSDYGECVGFSSFAITNSGVYIALFNEESLMVSDVDFNLSWYHDDAKTDGGWSLEQIDPYSPCAGAANWHASGHHNGGTPGTQNSVYADNPVEPRIDYVNVLSDNTIQLVFDQKMETNALKNTDNYLISEFDAHPVEATLEEGKSDRVTLVFEQSVLFHNYYTIVVFHLTNCSGIPVPAGHSCAFGLPGTAERGDVVINEILFDPISPAADYVEIYNHSDKVLNISDMQIGVVKTSFPNPPDTTIKNICSENRQLLPGCYALLTTKPKEIAAQYECSTDYFISMESFPSYPNSGATALLLFDGEIIDCMSYTDKSHYPLLTETKGVSLERVSPSIASDDPENWHSAAAPLYGTPGYQNSVFIENEDVKADVEIIPPIFSPDGDGYDDVTTISLSDFGNDYTAKIHIFDARGRPVKTLVNCKTIADQSRFVWNGLDDNDNVVPIGIYVVFVEVFDLQGDIKHFKKAVVVAAK